MFCSNCGNKCSDNALFCFNCGNKLNTAVVPETKSDLDTKEDIIETNPHPADITLSVPEPAPSSKKDEPEKKGVNPLVIILPIVGTFLLIFTVFAIIFFKIFFPSSSAVEAPSEVETQTEAVPEPEYIAVSSYRAYKSDMTWYDARESARQKGGALVSINNYDEFAEVCDIAEDANIKVFWVGATREYYESWSDANWLDGEDLTFTYWLDGEPTYISEEGEEEYCLMVFKVGDKWYFNDSVEDVSKHYSGKMGYIVEYTEYIEIDNY